MYKVIAKLVKDNKVIKTIYNVKSVMHNKKYGYFEITEHICTHDIITIHRFSDVDRIEMYKPDENYHRYEKVPYKVIERE